jgi:aerobic C4-dicarboxylate transport protein
MKLLKSLYIQVLIGIAAGVLFGYLYPDRPDTAHPGQTIQGYASMLRPLGDVFIKAVKMLIAPVIFATVVSGIAKMGDLKKLGWVGIKSLAYFLVVTTLALFIGLAVAHIVQPGANLPPQIGPAKDVTTYEKKAGEMNAVSFLTNIVPESFVGAFTSGEILQVLFLAILSGVVLAKLGPRVKALNELIHQVSDLLFGLIGIIVRVAPIAAFGAMAYTVGTYGVGTLRSLGLLLACVYVTCILFVFVVLGLIARAHGFSIWRLLVWIREEILLVLGTSSSETALPSLMLKLEKAGCAESVVGVVSPAGYAYNLDCTSI